MPTKINPIRYPTLYMYLARLPQGIASYPEVQTVASLPMSIREKWPDLGMRGDLPEDVMAAISKPYKDGEWVPDVHFMVLNALVRDVVYRDDNGYLQFCYDTMRASFSSGLMRAVMNVVSPTLLAMNAPKRWAMLKRGTKMTTLKSAKDQLISQLTYPPNMYHNCMLAGFGKSLQAAIDGARAKNSAVDVKVISDKECHFHVSWTSG